MASAPGSAGRPPHDSPRRGPAASPGRPALTGELLSALPDPVIGCDARGRIVYWSPAAQALYGFCADGAVGRRADVLLRTRFPKPLLEILEELEDVGRWQGRLVHRRRDGGEVAVESRWTARRDATGALTGGVAIERELPPGGDPAPGTPAGAPARTEPADRDLRRAERLESLGQLAGGVAHDFNNALAIIINYAAFVAGAVERLRTAPTEVKRAAMIRDLGEIRSAAERAARLTHQLLAFSPHQTASAVALDLNACIGRLRPVLERTAGDDVRLELSFQADLHPVAADPSQLEQALVDLTVNAREAMPAGGTLAIETANVHLDDAAVSARHRIIPGAYVRLRVSDTGAGMAPDVLEHAFDPFFTTKEAGRGAGLGLSSAYGVFTRAGGHVRLFSEPGVGTSFVAVLPAAGAPAAGAPAAWPVARGAAPAPAPGAAILLVEDEPPLREIVQRILSDAGYEVTVAADAAGALQIAGARAGRLDLLLTDMVMPGMLGGELARRVRALRPGISVLYMSGFSEAVFGAAEPVDPAALIDKPFTGPSLLHRVARALAAGRPG